MKILKNELLTKHTTFGIGGPAKYMVTVKTGAGLKKAIRWANQKKVPYLLLGYGSNVLVSDRGYAGLVIKNRIAYIRTVKVDQKSITIKTGSGTSLSALISYTLNKGYVGLHNFSYIPATVGGAVYMNAHFLDYFLSDFFVSGKVLGSDLTVRSFKKSWFDFGYDRSILKTNRQTLVEAVFCCERGDIKKAKKEQAQILARRKIYPSRSAGCIFKNLSEAEMDRASLSYIWVGYLIDKLLGLKGVQEGGARISPDHAAFMENTGEAKASEVLSLIRLVKKQAKKQYNIDLRLEIELIGFTKKELNRV